MKQQFLKIIFLLLISLSCCKSQKHAETTETIQPIIKGTLYTINIQGTILNIITRQPIADAKIKLATDKYFFATTDKEGNFKSDITLNDSVSKNNPTIFDQKIYQVGWGINANGFKTWFDSIHFSPTEKNIVRQKTTLLVPDNVDSLVLGWTIGNLLDTLKSIPYKQEIYFGKDNYVVLQLTLENDIFLQAYVKYETPKLTDFEKDDLSPAFFNGLRQQKIIGTGLLIYGTDRITRYKNINYPYLQPIRTYRVE
jgi:hypothetical protein